MILQRITLRDFRNFDRLELPFGPRFTVLAGHNGAGKTNLVEALYLLSTLRSFRTADLSLLVQHDRPAAQVDLRVYDPALDLDHDLGVNLTRHGTGARRTASWDGKTVRSGVDFYGRVRTVLFTPEDLAVLRGSPSGRRQFVDRMLFARERRHIADVQDYEKLLRSRNHVLKRDELSAGKRDELLTVYETGLSEVGARLWTRRTRFIEALATPFTDAFAQIHGHLGELPRLEGAKPAVAAVGYVAKIGEASEDERAAVLATALRDGRAEDLRRRTTTVGPHRDDVSVLLDGQPAAAFASQGQGRALVLGLKLAELRLAAVEGGNAPILLLDDVSSELDPRRSSMLFALLSEGLGQCVITTTDARYVTLENPDAAHWWQVAAGELRRVR